MRPQARSRGSEPVAVAASGSAAGTSVSVRNRKEKVGLVQVSRRYAVARVAIATDLSDYCEKIALVHSI